jgi:hypothetical protein
MTSISPVGLARARPFIPSTLLIVGLLTAAACGRSSEAPSEATAPAAEPQAPPPAAPAEPPAATEEAPSPAAPPEGEAPAAPVDEMTQPELEAACFKGRQEACDLLGE